MVSCLVIHPIQLRDLYQAKIHYIDCYRFDVFTDSTARHECVLKPKLRCADGAG